MIEIGLLHRLSPLQRILPDPQKCRMDPSLPMSCDSPGLTDTNEVHLLNQQSHLFPLNSFRRPTAGHFRPRNAPAITGGSVVFDAFCGLWSREKALSRTVDAGNPNEIVGLGKSNRPRASGCDLPVVKKTLQNSRFCRAGHNQRVNLVFQFSSGL